MRNAQYSRRVANFHSAGFKQFANAQEQLALLNRTWSQTRQRVPYWRSTSEELDLPVRFSSLEEFIDLVPVSDKVLLSSRPEEFRDPHRGPDWYRNSSGTTGTPTPMAAWRSENRFTELGIWAARAQLGIQPGSQLFLIWGHLHGMGQGWQPRWNRVSRAIRDELIGYRRHSAYDLDPARVASVWVALQRSAADYSIMLPTFLEQSVRVLHPAQLSLRETRVQVVILTGESLSRPRAEYERLLGVPVRMEYGTSETGVIAQEVTNDRYIVNTGLHLLEGVRDAGGDVLATVTSLYPRATPLIRYQIGDRIELLDGDHGSSVYEFRKVLGRVRPVLRLETGDFVHTAAVNHAMEKVGTVSRFQIVQREGVVDRISIVGSWNQADEASAVAAVRSVLTQAHPHLASVPLVTDGVFGRTRTGKTPVVFLED